MARVEPGLEGPGNGRSEPLASGGGVFSSLALAQYSALAHLRWRIFVNGLRSKMGAFEFGARMVTYVMYGLLGLGLGFGSGAAAYALAYSQKWQYLPVLFWVLFLLWQVIPVMLASFQEQFDLGTLLRFPVGFNSFFLLYVVFGLSDVSTIIGGLCCAGIWIGVTLVRPDLCAWAALALIVFGVFNILLVRAIFAWIDRWLSQRRTREILGAIFMVLLLSLQLMNPAVWPHGPRNSGSRRQRRQEIQQMLAEPWVRAAVETQAWLPPGLAGGSLRRASEGEPATALGSLGVLGLFGLAAGSALGLRLRAEYRGENLGAAPVRTKAAANAEKAIPGRERATDREGTWSFGGSGPIAAVIEKDMRSLFRTLPLLYAVGAPLILVLVMSGNLLRGGQRAHVPVFAFPLCVFFAQLGFQQLFGNSLGAEGAGIQLYFLAPTPMRTVLLAKNLFHSVIFFLAMGMAGVLATMRLGPPDGQILAITVAWLLFVLPCSLAIGNILSLTMPYRINPGRLTRQRRSQGSAFLGMFLQVAMLGVGALVYEACSIGAMPWLAVPIFIVLAAVAVFVWLRILDNSNELAARRKDQLIATLMKTE